MWIASGWHSFDVFFCDFRQGVVLGVKLSDKLFLNISSLNVNVLCCFNMKNVFRNEYIIYGFETKQVNVNVSS